MYIIPLHSTPQSTIAVQQLLHVTNFSIILCSITPIIPSLHFVLLTLLLYKKMPISPSSSLVSSSFTSSRTVYPLHVQSIRLLQWEEQVPTMTLSITSPTPQLPIHAIQVTTDSPSSSISSHTELPFRTSYQSLINTWNTSAYHTTENTEEGDGAVVTDDNISMVNTHDISELNTSFCSNATVVANEQRTVSEIARFEKLIQRVFQSVLSRRATQGEVWFCTNYYVNRKVMFHIMDDEQLLEEELSYQLRQSQEYLEMERKTQQRETNQRKLRSVVTKVLRKMILCCCFLI